MLAGQFVGGVNLVVARAAERRLVGAADHGGFRCLAGVALYLYLHLLRSQNSKLFLKSFYIYRSQPPVPGRV